jgi:hypothetical protein
VRNKYNSKKTIINGITFHSKKEGNRYAELLLLERSGEIKDLELQPKFVLQEPFTDSQHRKHRAITYKADFRYRTKDNMIFVEDVKGFKTEIYKIKKKLFLRRFDHLTFIET